MLHDFAGIACAAACTIGVAAWAIGSTLNSLI